MEGDDGAGGCVNLVNCSGECDVQFVGLFLRCDVEGDGVGRIVFEAVAVNFGEGIAGDQGNRAANVFVWEFVADRCWDGLLKGYSFA